MNRSYGLSGDLGTTVCILAALAALVGLVLLVVEVRRRDTAALVLATGVLASLFALLAVLRPVTILSRGTRVGPKVVVLVDRSRSALLPGDGGTRDAATTRAIAALTASARDARLTFVGFGEGAATPFVPGEPPRRSRSDLVPALRSVMSEAGEAPRAIVVISDGRLESPAGDVAGALKPLFEPREVPVHTVATASSPLRDASVRAVRAAGAAVAHQPLPVTIEIGCSGGLSCDALPVSVRELLDGAPPALLASGMARVENGTALLDLTVTLDRAGPRLVEIAIESPSGDEVPDNDRRLLVFDVARERVRVLHVAGRPTYDVRALRTWLKSNASVDVVAFFILRTDRSDVSATDAELALIRFPVDELFTEHLPSFDAVILQDFNAVPYRLDRYLGNLTKYVETGGGLVMVGGPGAFSDGGYAGSELERVLPVRLLPRTRERGETHYDLANVVPHPTAAGLAAPMLGPLRALFGAELPSMPGSNLVDDARDGSLVLWEHPTRKTTTGKPMPLLALGEFGDGRSVSVALDGAHRLGFSEMAARFAGRGHGALWDGLLGWLMRDPRFEPAQVELGGPCIAGERLSLHVTPLPGTTGAVTVEVSAASEKKSTTTARVELPAGGGPVDVPVGPLPAGGYMAKVRVGSGSMTRRAFACERGGDEWADTRPDEDKLRAIARVTGGRAVSASGAGSLTFPAATEVDAERTVTPLLPAWAWTLAAALALGAHWLARRRGGLALDHDGELATRAQLTFRSCGRPSRACAGLRGTARRRRPRRADRAGTGSRRRRGPRRA